MNIKFNQVDRTIEIKDGLKSHLFLMKLLMIVTLTNSVLNLSDVVTKAVGYATIIWLILGVVAGGFLYHFVVKRSGLEKIPVDQIQGFNARVASGRKKYYLSLKNGKTRDLLEVKTEDEAKIVIAFFKKNGILV